VVGHSWRRDAAQLTIAATVKPAMVMAALTPHPPRWQLARHGCLIRNRTADLYEVLPPRAFAFGNGSVFSQTRYLWTERLSD